MLDQISQALSPTALEIHNDSHLHSHHKAMVGNTSQETHFRSVLETALNCLSHLRWVD